MSEHKIHEDQEKKFAECWSEIKAVLARYGFVIAHRSVVVNGQPQTSELVLIPEPSNIAVPGAAPLRPLPKPIFRQ